MTFKLSAVRMYPWVTAIRRLSSREAWIIFHRVRTKEYGADTH